MLQKHKEIEEEKTTKKAYKTSLEEERVMNDFCFFFSLETGMVLIALGMIINFFYAAWDTYNTPVNRWNNPDFPPDMDKYEIGGLTSGFIVTVLIPRFYAAYWFTYWLFQRNDETRLERLPKACCVGAISTVIGTVWSIVNLLLDKFNADDGGKKH